EPRGFLKLITGNKPVVGHAGGGDLLGAHIIGPGAGDLIHEFALAMQVRAFAGRLAQTIHAYPTMALGVQQATAQLFAAGRPADGALQSVRPVSRSTTPSPVTTRCPPQEKPCAVPWTAEPAGSGVVTPVDRSRRRTPPWVNLSTPSPPSWLTAIVSTGHPQRPDTGKSSRA